MIDFSLTNILELKDILEKFISINYSFKLESKCAKLITMKEKLDIYFSKVFCRMRHKTQLFNGAADDHYHTRLQHTLEVEEIAIKIAKLIVKSNNSISVNFDKLSSIALLHDIGHTPFGHAGERGLHEIVSGSCCDEYKLPDFNKLGIAIGFKHNLNSGLLYRENVYFDDIDYDVLDGIVKHSKLSFKDSDGLDYGFSYIFQQTNDISTSQKTIEGFIVFYADEIAQVCSDYLDICSHEDSDNMFVKCVPYNELPSYSDKKRLNAKEACEILVSLFIKCFLVVKDYREFKDNDFTNALANFDNYRSKYIISSDYVSEFDVHSKVVVKSLFANYFMNPENMLKDFFDDFLYRVKRIKLTNPYNHAFYIDNLATKEEIIEFINDIQKKLTDCVEGRKILSSRDKKDYQTIMKMYIRSIAVYISKMTDNYAIHKFEKIA